MFVDHMCGFIIFYLNYIFDFTDETNPVLYDNKVKVEKVDMDGV